MVSVCAATSRLLFAYGSRELGHVRVVLPLRDNGPVIDISEPSKVFPGRLPCISGNADSFRFGGAVNGHLRSGGKAQSREVLRVLLKGPRLRRLNNATGAIRRDPIGTTPKDRVGAASSQHVDEREEHDPHQRSDRSPPFLAHLAILGWRAYVVKSSI